METTPQSGTEGSDSGAALLTVLMLMLVLTALSLLVLGFVVSQVRPTAHAQKSGRTLAAAESGVQAALGSMRAATTTADGTEYGDPSKLPCSLGGTVGLATEQVAYEVGIAYYREDPSVRDAAWRASSTNRLPCAPGSGVTGQPRYALITSRGAQAGVTGVASPSGDRSLESVYTFSTTNVNVPGGLFRTSANGFCLEAQSIQVGASVYYAAAEACASRGPLRLWLQDTDDKIKLAATVSSATPLCLTGGGSGNGNGNGNGNVTLRPCSGSGLTPDQVFSYAGNFRYRGTGGRCLWSSTGKQVPVTSGASRSRLVLTTAGCAGGSSGEAVSEYWSWNPEPAVGAGSAGYATGQLVNYAEFGRCLEVTQESFTANVMGIGPCKHAQVDGSSFWNQRWIFTPPTDGAGSAAPQPLKVTDSSTTRCLQTSTTTRSDGLGTWGPEYPALAACEAGKALQMFTVVGSTGDYASSYQVRDSSGRCLGVGAVYYPDSSPLSTVKASACTGAAAQKWNAPPNLTAASVTGTTEDVRASP